MDLSIPLQDTLPELSCWLPATVTRRRCSPDIIEEASPPEAAVATAGAAFPPRWSLTRCAAQRSAARNVPTLQVPRGAGPAVQRGFPARKLPL